MSNDNYSILRRVVTQEMGTGAAADAMYEYLCVIKSHESRGDRFAVNPDSKAKGWFQFVGSTAKEYGLGPHNIFDPEAQCRAVIKFTRDNDQKIARVLGREPDAGERYLAHFSGAGWASETLRSIQNGNPNRPIRDFFSEEALHNNRGIKLPSGKRFRDFTVTDLKNWADGVAEGKAYFAAREQGDAKSARHHGKKFLTGSGFSDEMADSMTSGMEALSDSLAKLIGFLLSIFFDGVGEEKNRTPTLEATNQPSGQPVSPTSVTFSKVTDTRAAAVSARG